MTRRTDNERLLAEVMGDSDAAFHEALLGETLRLARRRRRFRQARRTVAVLAGLVVLAALVWQAFLPRISTLEIHRGNYTVIQTQPLPVASLVTTQPLPADLLIASITTAGVVETAANTGQFREIGDNELLAMIAPKVAALVRLGPHEAELVVLEPASQEASPPN